MYNLLKIKGLRVGGAKQQQSMQNCLSLIIKSDQDVLNMLAQFNYFKFMLPEQE